MTDAAQLLQAVASYDEKDSTSAPEAERDFPEALKEDVKGMRIGIPKDYFGEGLDAGVKNAVLAAAKKLGEAGAVVEEFDLGMVQYAIPAYYTIATAEASSKTLIKRAFDEAFSKYDLILGPVAPSTAPKLGESLSDPLKMYLGDIYTIAVNLAGLPAISVPCGKDKNGLPIGLQLIGDCFAEKKLIRAAYTYEKIENNGVLQQTDA